MRVVLDTNVFVSGLLWPGTSHKLLQLAEDKKITLCITPAILEELHQVLNRPKFNSRIKLSLTSPEELIAAISKLSLFFPDIKIPHIVKDDPDDDKLIAYAEVSDAKYIVTGDPHLLKITKYRNISIVTPQKFLSI